MRPRITHEPTTLYSPLHPPNEPHQTSASKKDESTQLMTDTDNLNKEAKTPKIRYSHSKRQSRYSVIPNIKPTHLPDVPPSPATTKTFSRAEPVLTPRNFDAPHQPTRYAPPASPNNPPVLGDYNKTSSTAVTRTNHLKTATLTITSEHHHRFEAIKHATSCKKTLLQKRIKITCCCS